MKKLLILLVLLTGLHALTHAQTKTPLTAEQKAARATKTMQKRLGLTAEQATKVNAIYTMRTTQLDSVKMSPGQKGNSQKRKAIAANTNAQLQAVLTPEQKQQYAQWKDTQKQRLHSKKAAADSTAKKI